MAETGAWHGVKTDRRHFADILFRGGPVYTVDRRFTVAGACAVRGERILGTGDEAELLHLVGPETEVVDLADGCLLPGLIDAHSHIVAYGLTMDNVDCKRGVGCVEDIVGAVAAAARGRPPGEWVLGRGYDQKKLRGGRHPRRGDLDRAAPDHPVVLARTCGHIVACNSAALRLAGIDATTPDPPGGRIERDERGEPTGILQEAATGAVWRLLRPSVAGYRGAYARACGDYFRHGITSTHDASGGDPGQVRAIVVEQDAAQPRVRTHLMLRLGPEGAAGEAAMRAGLVTGLGGSGARVGPLKLMVDGSSSGPTAATRRPYASDPGDQGILYYDQATLDETVARGAAAGFQMTAHAVGDRAVEMMLRAFAGLGPEVAAARHRIEHCAMLDDELVALIRRLGVVPVANPGFLWEFGDGYVADYGPARAGWMFPLRALVDAGVPVALGSDAPVTDLNPFLGFYCAMTRRTREGAVVGAEQAVGFAEVLRAYTINAAYAGFAERERGSIETGKLADLVVVDRDLGRAGPEEVRATEVVTTLLGGKVVYRRD